MGDPITTPEQDTETTGAEAQNETVHEAGAELDNDELDSDDLQDEDDSEETDEAGEIDDEA